MKIDSVRVIEITLNRLSREHGKAELNAGAHILAFVILCIASILFFVFDAGGGSVWKLFASVTGMVVLLGVSQVERARFIARELDQMEGLSRREGLRIRWNTARKPIRAEVDSAEIDRL